MKARTAVVSLLAVIAVAAVMFMVRSHRDHVSLMLIHGTVYTLDDTGPSAEAIAVDGDRIAAVGGSEDLLRRFKADTTIDLKGQTVFPGFIDSHAHMEGLGLALMTLNLAGTTSVEQIQKKVAEEIAGRSESAWVRGRGWDQTKWSDQAFPTYQMLDAVSSTVPIILMRIDGHAAWVNSKVLSLAGISRDTPDPPGGRIVRSHDGSPSGVFLDNAMDTLRAVMPTVGKGERRAALLRASEQCVKMGLTEVHDMGVDLDQIAIYKELLEEGNLPLRIYAAIDGSGATWEHYKKSGPEIGIHDGRLTVRALKLYADGALGSRGAALIEAYTDDPGNRGLTTTSSEMLLSDTQAALETGFQVCVHAIGDRANNIVLNVYEKSLTDSKIKTKNVRFRVEHAQVLTRSDIPRFARLGVIPAMQPTHCTSDMYWAEARLGAERTRGAYAWRSLIDAGSVIPAGSDFPVESPNPLLGIYAAVTRQDVTGWPAEGWHPEERMSRLEALEGYTKWGAYAAFQEHDKGMIKDGMWADLVVVSKDLMKVDPREIPATEIFMTIVGGKIVYSLQKGEQRVGGSPSTIQRSAQ